MVTWTSASLGLRPRIFLHTVRASRALEHKPRLSTRSAHAYALIPNIYQPSCISKLALGIVHDCLPKSSTSGPFQRLAAERLDILTTGSGRFYSLVIENCLGTNARALRSQIQNSPGLNSIIEKDCRDPTSMETAVTIMKCQQVLPRAGRDQLRYRGVERAPSSNTTFKDLL